MPVPYITEPASTLSVTLAPVSVYEVSCTTDTVELPIRVITGISVSGAAVTLTVLVTVVATFPAASE